MSRPELLVVGATGRVGRLLAPHLRKAGEVTVLEQTRDGRDGTLRWSDLADAKPLRAHAERNGAPSAILMLAGVTPASGAALHDNRRLALAILQAARDTGVPRILLASSSAVYGTSRGRPFNEDDKPHPANGYGRAKRDMETAVADQSDVEVCCLRIGNVLGADALMTNALDPTLSGDLRLEQYPDGDGPRRSYIGPATLADVVVKLTITKAVPPVLNVAAPTPVSMAALLKAAGRDWKWTPAQALDTQDIILDCRRLESLHRFAPGASDPAAMIAQLNLADCSA